MKKLDPKEQFDRNLEKYQAEDRKFYQNHSAVSGLKSLILPILCFNLILWILSILCYETTLLQRVGMLVIIIFEALFWLCSLKESCFYYYRTAIANYYYQIFLYSLYGIATMIFEVICPVFRA